MRYETTDENRALMLVMASDGGVFLCHNLDEGIAGVVFVFSLVLLWGKL
jgi:hypothetical protein